MNRRLLEQLYSSDPERALQRALSEQPISADTLGFICEKAVDLTANQVCLLLDAKLETGIERRDNAALSQMARLVAERAESRPEEPHPSTDRFLRCAEKVSAEAWLQDVVRPLQNAIQPRLWYAYVSKARGGTLFPAVIAELLSCPNHGNWSDHELGTIREDNRTPDPHVVRAAENAHNDLELKKLVLTQLSLAQILRIASKHRDFFPETSIAELAASRLSEPHFCFVDAGTPTRALPKWIQPLAIERIRHCGDGEALALYEWLYPSQSQARAEDSAYELAVLRFKTLLPDVTPESLSSLNWWGGWVGLHLDTGTAWKRRGREFLRLCVEGGRGFPESALDAALNAAPKEGEAQADQHRRAILRRSHEELAMVLVELAEQALAHEQGDRAKTYLSAFLCLDPGKFIGGALSKLAKRSDLSGPVRKMVETSISLSLLGGKDPSREQFSEAFLCLLKDPK